MACKHNRAPIDIKSSLNKNHSCELKCTYQFQYSPSQLLISNKGTYLSLGDYNSNSSDKVIYNNRKVDDHINPYIFSPSVHTFNGITHDAELIVVHKGNGRMMVVCIPINGLPSSNTSMAKVLDPDNLDHTILKAESYLPSIEYNLSDSIKVRVPFFSYSSQLFFDNCEECDYIVYTEPIIITSSSISALRNILKPHNIPICTTNCVELYYNKTGATDGTSSDEIYIECQPTDHSGKEIPVPTESALPNIDQLTGSKGIKVTNSTWHIIIGALSGIIIISFLAKFSAQRSSRGKV